MAYDIGLFISVFVLGGTCGWLIAKVGQMHSDLVVWAEGYATGLKNGAMNSKGVAMTKEESTNVRSGRTLE